MLSELWLDHCKLGALPERMPHLKTLKVRACACVRWICEERARGMYGWEV